MKPSIFSEITKQYGLWQLSKETTEFEVTEFLEGVQQAYTSMHDCLEAKNLEDLRPLVSPQVYANCLAMHASVKDGSVIAVRTKLEGFKETSMVDVRLAKSDSTGEKTWNVRIDAFIQSWMRPLPDLDGHASEDLSDGLAPFLRTDIVRFESRLPHLDWSIVAVF